MDDEFKILVPKDIPSPEQYENGPGTEWYEQWKDLTPRESALRQAGFLIAVAQGAANDSKESRDRREDARNAGARALIAYCNIARAADDLPYRNSDEFFRSINNLMGYAFEIGQLSGTRDIRAMKYLRPFIETDIRRDRTKEANTSRRKISAIVMRLADALWISKPIYKNNANGTATEIRAAVSAEAAKARDGEPLKGWPADEKTEIERIRKCIERALKKAIKV